MKQSFIFCAIVLVFMGCKDDPEPVIQLLINTDMEVGGATPYGWRDLQQTVYTTTWTTEAANSASRSLKISATQANADTYTFWAQSYMGIIPVGKDVVLSVKVKCKNVSGKGISLAIRCDNAEVNSSAEQFSTTQNNTLITGDFDWTTYTVHLNAIKSDINSITVYFLYLDHTVGTAYFDDATLTVQ